MIPAREHTPRNRDSGETGPRSPPYFDWSGRNKRGSRQRISPHLRDRPFVGIGWPLSFLVLSGPLSIFLPLFFPPRALHLPLYERVGPLFLFGPTLQHIGALASLWPPAFVLIIIIIVIRAFLFLRDQPLLLLSLASFTTRKQVCCRVLYASLRFTCREPFFSPELEIELKLYFCTRTAPQAIIFSSFAILRLANNTHRDIALSSSRSTR